MASNLAWGAMDLYKRQAEDADSDESDAGQKEIFASWSLFILIFLLIVALFTSYILKARKIQAVHETVISIFVGMVVGLLLRLTATDGILVRVTFKYQFFFNLLLPPIILASGYELHQGNFFRKIGTILTFAFAGTFISALVLAIILYVWALLPFETLDLSFVDAMSVGATLSATDPVTILAIFTTYKVDPGLYTVIFGESILNDAVAIVLFETAQRYRPKDIPDDAPDSMRPDPLTIFSLVESAGVFLLVFFGSLIIGLIIGIGTSLLLKYTYIRRFPKLESCIILLIAYASYFFANAVHMSGIVALLFCGICLKHYAYYNMSRRSQLTTKFIFQVLAQLSENFIFIYLGLSLFTESGLDFRPLFILVAVVGLCVARWLAVFPLSAAINWFVRFEARRKGTETTGELSYAHQAMIFWAGLRGAVGVALAQGLTGKSSQSLRATVLVVVVLTVIIFGGTTARMLEILGIRTGVVEEPDSDDEFDIEIVPNGTYQKRNGTALGHYARSNSNSRSFALENVGDYRPPNGGGYSSSNARNSPPDRPGSATTLARKNSLRNVRDYEGQNEGLLSPSDSYNEEATDLDLPPSARRPRDQPRTISAPAAPPAISSIEASHQASGSVNSTSGSIRQFFSGSREDPSQWFRQIDEGFIKPTLLLDPGDGRGHGHGNGNGQGSGKP